MKIIALLISIIAIAGLGMYGIKNRKKVEKEKPEDLIVKYMNHIEKQEYEAMYSMIDSNSATGFGKEEFIERNSKIYKGMDAKNVKLSNIVSDNEDKNQISVSYHTSLDTIAGEVNFENSAIFIDTENGYKLSWMDSLIFPRLSNTDKISVSTFQAKRGKILDRNGQALAGKGTAISVGIVPGKLETKKQSLKKLADLLEMDVKTVKNKLAAKWVKEDSFVPIATIPKVNEIDLIKIEPEKSVLKEHQRQEQMLKISGVMFTDVEIRSYPLGEAAAHLIGYVQTVTADDLKNHAGEGYNSNSVIGRSGMEGLFEKTLKGKDGYKISIIDSDGKTKEVIASVLAENGENIQLTIDSELQRMLYKQFKDDNGCSVAINPYTGEVLALVSTPSYDNNDFIMGMASKEWTSLNKDKNKPLYNRFQQLWCPGSVFKPVVAGIGLKTGTVNPNEDFGNEGLSWQKDSSWGSYQVTTLHKYSPATMKNAIIYSDNIFFAKAALKIGADNFMKSLDEMGFNQELPFEITMSKSQYSNTKKFETEIQLADSGYGQGQILVNPLHLASIYTAFLNRGDMIKPYLRYRHNGEGEVWLPKIFTADNANEVMKGVKGVIGNRHGTGYAAHRDDIVLAGKTGTAEIKGSKEDTTGTEIGWFTVFTTDRNTERPILIVSMVENVKGIGGSGYVVSKDKAVLDEYLGIIPA